MSAARSVRGSMPTTSSAWNRRMAATFAANAQRETEQRKEDLDAAFVRIMDLMAANGHEMGPRLTKRSGTGSVCVRCGAWACVRQTAREVARNGNYAVYEWDLMDSFSDPSTHCRKVKTFAAAAASSGKRSCSVKAERGGRA